MRYAILLMGVLLFACGSAAAQSQNMELISQMGGSSYAVAADGIRAVIGEGGGVRVLDISQPGNPIRRGKVLLGAGLVRAIALEGNLAFVAAENDRLFVVDVSTPDSPTVAGWGQLGPGQAWNVGVQGAHAFVVSSDWGATTGCLTVLRISGTVLTKVAETPIEHPCVGLCFLGNFMPVSGNAIITLLDITNPEAPVVRWKNWMVPIEAGTADIAAQGNMVYGVLGANGLSSFDFSNIDDPVFLQALEPPALPGLEGVAFAVKIRGNDAFVACGLAGVAMADCADPAHMGWTSVAGTTTPAARLALLTTRTIAVSEYGGVWDVDVTDPMNLSVLGGYTFPGLIQDIAAQSIARVHTACDMGGYQLLDFSNPALPVQVGTLFNSEPLPGPRIVLCSCLDNDVVIGRWTPIYPEVQTVSLANPSKPVVLGGCRMPTPNSYLAAIAVSGQFCFAADDLSALNVVDCSNPTSTSVIASIAQGTGNYCVNVAAGTAYTGSLEGRMSMADVSDPVHPVSRGDFDTTIAVVSALARHGNLLAIVQDGFTLLDITSPFAPVEVGAFDFGTTLNQTMGIAFDGDLLYVTRFKINYALEENRVEVYDVSNPASPALAGFFTLPATPTRVIATAGDIFVGDWTGGVYQLRYNPPVAVRDWALY
ncbi:MAG: hypothetical protein WCK89_22155 [bacterium]